MDEDQLHELEHVAVEEGLSFEELVRRTLKALIEAYRDEGVPLGELHLDASVSLVRGLSARYRAKENEEDVTAASAEVRGRSTRRRAVIDTNV